VEKSLYTAVTILITTNHQQKYSCYTYDGACVFPVDMQGKGARAPTALDLVTRTVEIQEKK